MGFPETRMRDRRVDEAARAMYRQTSALSSRDLIMPIFIKEGITKKRAIRSMPGIYQWPVKYAAVLARKARDLGISGVILFGIPAIKDEAASSAYDEDGIVQRAIRQIKKKAPGIDVIADVCMCEYTSHGHCGIIKPQSPKTRLLRPFPPGLRPDRVGDGPRNDEVSAYVDNDATIEVLAKIALSYASAGVDTVAPSAMMDGQVKAIKQALVDNGSPRVRIMSYSVKYASSLYAPFRDAAESPPQFGDRKTYQMDYHNSDEAVLEARLDIEEGADMLMVKPALGYEDIIYRVSKELDFPLACYSVSGEYAMMKAAASKRCINERDVVLEVLTGFKRAGAEKIITYYAMEVAGWLRSKKLI